MYSKQWNWIWLLLLYYYAGKLFVGLEKTKLIDSNLKVKEDNVIVDKIGQVGLRVWDEMKKKISK